MNHEGIQNPIPENISPSKRQRGAFSRNYNIIDLGNDPSPQTGSKDLQRKEETERKRGEEEIRKEEGRKDNTNTCPVCNQLQSADLIEWHVEECLKAEEEREILKSSASLNKSNDSVSNNNYSVNNNNDLDLLKPKRGSSGLFLNPKKDNVKSELDPIVFYDEKEQAEMLEIIKKMKEQEEEDRKLAWQLANEQLKSQNQTNNDKDQSNNQNKEENQDSQNTQEDIGSQDPFHEGEEKLNQSQELTQSFEKPTENQKEYRDEEELDRLRKKIQEEDERFIQELLQKEKEEELKRNEEEWKSTVELLKEEAKLESDQELDRIKREKEELEKKLHELQKKEPIASIALADIVYPDDWTKEQDSDCERFIVDKESEEFRRVQNRFNASKIVKLERIQNRRLWMWYFLKRKTIAANNKNNANEQFLFHGSRTNSYKIIIEEGLDFRMANMNGSNGAGIYFAPDSQTSVGYVPNQNDGYGIGNKKAKKHRGNNFAYQVNPFYGGGYGNHNPFGYNNFNNYNNYNNYHNNEEEEEEEAQGRQMLLCRVALGSVGPGAHGLRRPPPLYHGSNRLHDSVSDAQGVMRVIFDNHQSYPEYLIHF